MRYLILLPLFAMPLKADVILMLDSSGDRIGIIEVEHYKIEQTASGITRLIIPAHSPGEISDEIDWRGTGQIVGDEKVIKEQSK